MPFLKAVGFGIDSPFDPSHRFATSWLLPPGLLFAFRALLSVYAFVTAFFNLGWRGTQHLGGVGQSFSFFTNLTYWGLAFYFAFSALHTGTYWLTGRPLLARWPPALQTLHSIYYSTITNFPFIVTSKRFPSLFPPDMSCTTSHTSKLSPKNLLALPPAAPPSITPHPCHH